MDRNKMQTLKYRQMVQSPGAANSNRQVQSPPVIKNGGPKAKFRISKKDHSLRLKKMLDVSNRAEAK